MGILFSISKTYVITVKVALIFFVQKILDDIGYTKTKIQ